MIPVPAKLHIDWTQMPTYNTIMCLAAGAGLLLVVWCARDLLTRTKDVAVEGFALAFGVLGVILTATGFHMTVTWPLAGGGAAYDNVIFGEMSLGFGVLLLAAAFYLWRRGREVIERDDAVEHLIAVSRPVSVIVFGLGLALLGIALAGAIYRPFAAPPEEPIAGAFAAWPWVESFFLSGLYALVGLGAVLAPFALRPGSAMVRRVVGWAWGLAGLAFLVFAGITYFTHIGLIINTM